MGKKYLFKVVLIGNGAVGKTATLYRFVKKEFKESYMLTIGAEFLKKQLKFKKDIVELLIWDMAGQDRFANVRKSFYTNTAGALLMFDLTNADTFFQLDKWLTELKQNAGDVPFVLIGNKVDLVETVGRTLDPEETKKFAESHGSIYIETSAKTGVNIEEAFNELCLRIGKARGVEIK